MDYIEVNTSNNERLLILSNGIIIREVNDSDYINSQIITNNKEKIAYIRESIDQIKSMIGG